MDTQQAIKNGTAGADGVRAVGGVSGGRDAAKAGEPDEVPHVGEAGG